VGAHPYQYVVDYQEDPRAALAELRHAVFQGGAYHGVTRGARTPEEALKRAGETGTRSILDIERIAPRPDYGCAAPLTGEEVQRYFGTTMPTVAMIEQCDRLWNDLERGMARYLVAFEQDRPRHLVFIGYSFD